MSANLLFLHLWKSHGLDEAKCHSHAYCVSAIVGCEGWKEKKEKNKVSPWKRRTNLAPLTRVKLRLVNYEDPILHNVWKNPYVNKIKSVEKCPSCNQKLSKRDEFQEWFTKFSKNYRRTNYWDGQAYKMHQIGNSIKLLTGAYPFQLAKTAL